MVSANHRERQIMQYLRAGGWGKNRHAAVKSKVTEGLLNKAWISDPVPGAIYAIASPTRASQRRRCLFEFILERRHLGAEGEGKHYERATLGFHRS
jgi:hypothetical protein